jgi:single-strand DNA-binding protein
VGGRVPPGWLEDNDMTNDANIDLAGFVASEPSFKRLATGTSHAKLRVAYTERRLNRETGEWGDGPTSFVTVLCWRSLADNVAMCLRKGEPVLVRGRLRVREYEGKDGSRGTETEIDASSVGHDLNRGVAHFSRTRRAPGETAAESAEALAAAQPQDGEEQDPPAGRDGPGLPGDAAGDDAAASGAAGGNGTSAGGNGTAAGGNGTGTGGNGASASGNRTGGNGAGEKGAGRKGTGEKGAGRSGAGGGVLDDGAVAEFANEMTRSLEGTPA